jgi:hypothetical protein
MRKIVALAALLMLPLAAAAQDGRRYAVLSLVGDKLTVVLRELSTGTNLDRNEHQVVEMPDNAIDRAVVLAVDDALRQAVPGAKPILLATQRADLYAVSYQSMDYAGGVAKVYAAVKPIVEKSGATHLVLVTKHRSRAKVRLRDGMVGSGFLEGVGFYTDQGTLARGIDGNDSESGFISPYAYMRISLVEVATGRIVSEKHVLGSDATSSDPRGRNYGNAWLRLSEEQKIEKLRKVIVEETNRAVPMVVAAK